MAYVPHTDSDRREMLATIGASSIDELFEEIPEEVRFPELNLPEPLSESEILDELRALSEKNWDLDHHACFLGAGAYNHFIPSVVRHVLARGEFFTAYTPYQPEVSQGTLQATFEYQSMICDLTGMEVANASHYDGATSLAEALIMSLTVHRGRRRKVVISRGVNPQYRQTAHTYTNGMGLQIVTDTDSASTLADLAGQVDTQTACVVIQVPDFLGRIPPLEELIFLEKAVHQHGALLVVSVNPISLGLLRPPGEYGADIVVGEGQPLGNSLSFGGPYVGFFACRMAHVRRMAGRLVGMTEDTQGRRGFVLTLATREQHIRREKATSNICTNQALNALAAAAYMSAMGPSGLRAVASLCYHKAHYAASSVQQLSGYQVLYDDFFHEFVIRCPKPVKHIATALLEERIIPGYDLSQDYPDLGEAMLVCVTELNTRDQIDHFVATLEAAV